MNQKSKIAQGCLTYSKRADQWLHNQPKFCVAPKGHVQTIAQKLGNDNGFVLRTDKGLFMDFSCGLGCNLIGWQNTYSLPTNYEEQLAEKICNSFPFVDKVKIMKTGSDACMGAVRIARACTEGKKGIGCGYHGIANTFIASEYPGKGCYDENYWKSKNFETLITNLKTTSNTSYCIIEPFELDCSDKTIKQLGEIREICTKKGIILIYDEVITGFRVPSYSVANYTGIYPDIICLGKALGNGYPISIIGGSEAIMETPDYFLSGTFFGDTAALKAALKTLDFLTEERLQALWDNGIEFQKEMNSIDSRIQLKGLPTRGVWAGPWEWVFKQEMANKGYLLGKAWFLNFYHTEEILGKFLADAQKVVDDIKAEKVVFQGEIPQPVFKRHA